MKMSSDPLVRFARRIGWRDISGDGSASAREGRLGQFKQIYERRCSWPVMGYASRDCAETGEQYTAALRSFAERPQIWHIYERIQRKHDRPAYLVTYSADGTTWQEIGYFNRWPHRWKKPENNLIQRMFSLYMKLRFGKKLKALGEMQRGYEG